MGEEPLATAITGRNLLELKDVSQTDAGVSIDVFHQRLVPEAGIPQFGCPTLLLSSQAREQLHQLSPTIAYLRWWGFRRVPRWGRVRHALRQASCPLRQDQS